MELAQANRTSKEIKAQSLLSEARKNLKHNHAEATHAVVDPTPKNSRLTARQRARYPKFTANDDILTTVGKSPFASLDSSEQYLLQPEHPSVEPFYAQFEEIRGVKAQFSLQARSSHAQVNPQARR